jgi:hypothetical protein
MKRPSAAYPVGEVLLAGLVLLGLLVKVPGFSLFPASVFAALVLLPIIATSFRATTLLSALTVWVGIALTVGLILSLTIARESGAAGGIGVAAPVIGWIISVPLIIALGVWAFERIGINRGIILLFAGALVSSIINAGEIGWKGSIGFYTTLFALAVVAKTPLFFARVILVGAVVLATVSDARSMTIVAALTLAATFVNKRTLDWGTRQPFRALVLIAMSGAVAAFLAIQAMQSGLLGAAVQQRTLEQMRFGSLITGARAEWAATLELFRAQPLGFGTGVAVHPGLQSQAVSAVRAVGGDADAGYFRVLVFGDRTDLHSQLADLWFHFGIPGIVVAVLMMLILTSSTPHLIGQIRVYGAAPIMAALIALWDIPFSPMADIDRTIAGLVLAIAVTLASRRNLIANARFGLLSTNVLSAAPSRNLT